MAEAVLDASALLAVVGSERGAERVLAHLSGARMSAVNLAEVLGKLTDLGMPLEFARDLVERLGPDIEPLDEAQAVDVAALRRPTRGLGLSIGDRSCLALAADRGVPAVTADRAWSGLDVGVEVVVIR